MKYPALPLCLLLSVFISLGCFAQNNFTVEEILGSSFPTGLVCSDYGEYAAWVENHQGIRNIYISDGTTSKKLTAYEEDDGQEISNLVFSPDHSFLIFVRGGAPNRSGEIPNPLSLPSAAKREIWKINLDDNSLGLISEGSSLSLSHDGKILAFINHGQAWKADLETGVDPKLFFSVRGSVGSLKWSPDNSKLVFLSNRGDHSFIGVFNLSDKKIIYLSPSVDQDIEPAWSPDSRHLAFIRIPNESQNLPFTPRRCALPWSIRIGDPESGNSSEIWTATEGAGSAVRGISANDQLFWASDNKIVFPWEGDGWTHLYSINTW